MSGTTSNEKIRAAASAYRETKSIERAAEVAGLTVQQARAVKQLHKVEFGREPCRAHGVPVEAPGACGVVYADHKESHCRYPLWRDGERFNIKTSRFCSAPRADGSAYCEYHRGICEGIGTEYERNAVADAIKLAKRGA